MHNTIHRKPATKPTCRDAAIQILGSGQCCVTFTLSVGKLSVSMRLVRYTFGAVGDFGLALADR